MANPHTATPHIATRASTRQIFRSQTQQGAIRVILPAAIVLLLGAGALAWWLLPSGLMSGLDISVDGAVRLIRSWGAWGMAGSIGLMVAHSFLPFPAEVVALANGLVYGPLWGAAITWLGAMLGGSAAFGLTRLIGRPLVHRLLSGRQQARLASWSDERGGGALLVSRFIPVIAFNLINYAAALTGISWWTFLWATGLGILPGTILLAVLGNRMLIIPLWAWVLIATGAALVCLAAEHRWRKTSRRDKPGARLDTAGGPET